MIYAAPGASFEATLTGAPTGLAGTIGVRILDNAGGTTLARATAGIAEFPAGSGFYAVTLTAPTTAGQFSVFWDTGAVGPTTTSSEDLIISSSAAPSAVPSGSDLTTLAAVRAFLGKQTADTNQDSLITSLITRASKEINNFTGREFAPTTSQTARKFIYNGKGFVDLSPFDLRTIGAGYVKIDSDATSPLTLTTDQYRLRPRQSPDGTYGWMELDRAFWGWAFGSYGPNPSWAREVEVKGDWGFASVPDDVNHWCIVTVVTWLRRDASAFETTFSIPEERLDRPEALPAAVRGGLAHYKRDPLLFS